MFQVIFNFTHRLSAAMGIKSHSLGRGMTQHSLNITDVCTSFQQMSSKTMA